MFGHADIDIQTEVKTKTTVNVNGHNLDEVIADPHHEQKEEKTTMCSGYSGIADPHPGQKINNSIW